MALATAPRPSLDIFRPIFRAYTLVYFSTSSFQVVRLIPKILSKKHDVSWFIKNTLKTLRESAEFDRFPAHAALLVTASTVVPRVILNALSFFQESTKSTHRIFATSVERIRFLSVLIASIFVFRVLNGGTREPLKSTELTAGYAEAITTRTANGNSQPNGDSCPPSPITPRPLAGKTLFLTSFAAVHALAVIGSTGLCALRSISFNGSLRNPTTVKTGDLVAPVVFILSSTVIMWTWFYTPERLPKEYGTWISSASQADMRLVRSMRQARLGLLYYGKDTNYITELSDIAKDHEMPPEWADHTRTVPIPCELVHCGAGPNCEFHAMLKFLRGWTFAMRMYLPLNLFFLCQKKLSGRKFLLALLAASRSSSFLGAFTGLFYYGICLGRTRVGPMVVGVSNKARTRIEAGICTRVACIACGFSILIERRSRRNEMALFVAPRALSALLPRRYDAKYLWLEQLAFASSVATILTTAMVKPANVRGVFGRLLSKVYG